ncbi:MAG TPA: phosphate signaling complex protein PhoU, partial [Bacteroidia bacterium]|nr:phosphate signaling complex protein PhoU [Bacteroidia bacterium]
MSHLDTEIHRLREELIEMQRVTRTQIAKSRDALFGFDRDLAREVIENERIVNAIELKIDRDCENILALFQPVAVDLRFVLATLKINSNLERIGDNVEGIARYVLDVDHPFRGELLAEYRVEEMYQIAISMVDDTMFALLKEDTALARKVFFKDDTLDEINKEAARLTLKSIAENRPDPKHYLNALSIIRKLERVGDQTKNIAEEIIFFIEA